MNTGRVCDGTTWSNIKLEQYLYLKINEEGKNGRDYIPKLVVPNLTYLLHGAQSFLRS